jgi:hypothetical protein
VAAIAAELLVVAIEERFLASLGMTAFVAGMRR